MTWIEMNTETVLNSAVEASFKNNGIVIFKHSTRCSISAVSKSRLSVKWNFKEELPIYYLDLIQHRALSNLIAEKFNVQHESPQLLLIKNGKCIYHASHLSISVKHLHQALEIKT
ncbi:MAG: bacillithiol system redox-active protein YtxJ [Vicingus serpentipes]|nr:bacillithiol system redox-active protein YtxJ [Vicingus serpentipes]